VDGGPENLAPPPGRRVSARCARAGAVLSELLPQTPLGARTRKAKSSKTSRAVEEEAVLLISGINWEALTCGKSMCVTPCE